MLYKQFSPTHACHILAGRFVDVLKVGDTWEAIEVCEGGGAGVGLATGPDEASVLAKASALFQPSESLA